MPAPRELYGPLAITPRGLRQLLDAVPEALQTKDASPLEGTRRATVRDGVAIIPVSGPLFRRESIFSMLFSTGSYESIAKDFQAALENPGVRAIAFDVDSPGGEVHGAGELSKAIFEARGKKPIVAYVSGQCASAAYWLASAADKVVTDPTAEIGSIGVRTVLIDDSKRDEAQGIKEYDIVSSQSPYKTVNPADASDRARVQAGLTAMARVFIDDVARNRKVSAVKVMDDFGQGDIMIGRAAATAGLTDGVGDFESLLASLGQGQKAPRIGASRKVNRMSTASMNSKNCSKCAKDMGDDDEMYCGACHGGASGSFMSEVFAVLGVSDPSKALGALAAMKQQAERTEKLLGELEAIRALQRKAESKQLIDEAVLDGRVVTAKRGEAEAIGEKYGIEGLRSFLALIPKHSASQQLRTEVDPDPAKLGTGAALSKSQLEILKMTGVKPEDFAAHAAKYRQMINPTEQE